MHLKWVAIPRGLGLPQEINMYKTIFPMSTVVCLMLNLFACGRSAPQDLILGKWKTGQGGIKVAAEFDQGGVAKITMFGQTLQGTYKIEGDELVWTVNGRTTKSKMKVTAKELEVTASNGTTIVYTRE
jgi:hypothetical protein